MQKSRVFISLFALCSVYMVSAQAIPPVDSFEEHELNTALVNTYAACVGIDDGLADMKKMAGINTAISGVGTGLAAGAAVVGFSKAHLDKNIEMLEDALNETQEEQRNAKLEELDKDFARKYLAVTEDKVQTTDQATAKSKKLGNWRTGLMAGNAATSVASAIIAAKNKVSDDLRGSINDCIAKVHNLSNAIIQARIAGIDVTEAQSIYNACREYEYIDLSPIDKRAKGALISSTVSAVTGGVGTVTSAMANSDKVRDGDKTKEKNLNTASNALAVGSGVASAAATIFNATQISAIKKVATVSEKCTGVLK